MLSFLIRLLLGLRVDVNVCVVRILTYSSASHVFSLNIYYYCMCVYSSAYAFSLNIYHYCMCVNTGVLVTQRVCTSQRIIGITLILTPSAESRNFPQLTRVVLQVPLLSEVSERF